MAEGSMPPGERPSPRRQEGEQEHLRENAGMSPEGLGSGQELAEYLQEDTGGLERKEDDNGLVDKAKDKLKGS